MSLVYFQGTDAVYAATMDYCGNRAEETVSATLTNGSQTYTTPTALAQGGYFEPWHYALVVPGQRFGLPVSCGYTATVFGQHTAKVTIFIDIKGITTPSIASVASSNVARQPDCAPKSCDPTGTSERDDPSNPYYDPATDPNCSSTGNGGSTGSGTQFAVGDYTNGETVDFATGIGNGGTSVCGKAAQVVEVCVDRYNEATGQWVESKCGYATSC